MSIKLQIRPLSHGEGLALPTYHSLEAAGADLVAAVASPVMLEPGAFALVPAGFAMALPQGYEAQVRPRSGLAFKHGVTVLNAPGTIDSDYRGEVKALLINHGAKAFEITRGLRMAQMVIAPVIRATFQITDTLDDSPRGTGGFGSTGQG